MADQTGGPGSYFGTGNIFDGIGTGTYILGGDGLLGITGNAGATVADGTIADITLGLDLLGIGVAALGTVEITALTGGVADIQALVGTVAGPTTFNAQGGLVEIGSTVAALNDVIVNISQGGQFDSFSSLLGLLSQEQVNFGAGGGNFAIESSGLSINLLTSLTINNFAQGDVIDDDNIAFGAVQEYTINSAGLVTFFSGVDTTGQLGGLQFAPGTFTAGTYGAATGPLVLTDHDSFLQIQLACFLRGSHIATQAGPIAVERLAAGDMVVVVDDGEQQLCPVKWIGHRHVDVRDLGGSVDAYPVRIRAHAFAENKPVRDLLVTSEHCIHVAGRLVPVRMLVNGSSILVDTSISKYEFFHVELDRHAILIAEGLETESYIDTGNRGNFANAVTASLRPGFRVDAAHEAWAEHAAAPLAVARETVEPIWSALAGRAATLGLAASGDRSPLIADPDLHLLTEHGIRIRPMLCDGKVYAFMIPEAVRAVKLVSRASRPSQTVGPFLDDRRMLGVLAGCIGVSVGRDRVVLDHHLGDRQIAGWHPREAATPGRWTSGDALINIELPRQCEGPVWMDIEILSAGPYLIDAAQGLAIAA